MQYTDLDLLKQVIQNVSHMLPTYKSHSYLIVSPDEERFNSEHKIPDLYILMLRSVKKGVSFLIS